MRVSWRDLLPWLLLFRTFALAIRVPILLTALLATLVLPLGWRTLGWCLLDSDRAQRNPAVISRAEQFAAWPGQSASRFGTPQQASLPNSLNDITSASTGIFERVYHRLVSPFVAFVQPGLFWGERAYFGLGAVWTLAIWAFAAGIISRMSVVELGREERVGLGDAVRFSCGRWRSYFAAPLFPIIGVALCLLPMMLLGLIMRFDFGMLIGGVLWIFVLLGGFVAALFLLGLVFGWPLMWPAISSEDFGDAFEAFHRSYSYTYQKPLQYLFYALVVALFSSLCWLLVYYFTEAVIAVSHWGVRVGAGELRFLTREAEAGWLFRTGLWFVHLGNGMVRSLATAFCYSFFFSASSAIYLLLRRDTDNTELDEIYLPDEQPRYHLPTLTPDAAGVPGPADPPGDASASRTDV